MIAISCLIVCISTAFAAGSDNSSLTNDPEFKKANELVKAGQWAQALPVLLRLVADIKDSADIHNLLGVTYRKLKDYPTSKQHYDRALAIDYAHLPTLEYQGEWFLETGDLASAKKNLATLKMFCGTCHEYRDLEAAIAAFEAQKSPAGSGG